MVAPNALLITALALGAAGHAFAQTPPPPAPPAQAVAQAPPPAQADTQTVCGQVVPTPAKLPPSGSGPVVTAIAPCFQKQGGSSVIDAQTYLFYIQAKDKVSRPTLDRWVPYNEEVEQIATEDFRRLWATNFLDDLQVRVEEYKYANGVIGKVIVYDMEERQRVKIVDYVGTKELDSTKIDEKLKEKSVTIRYDSFIDPALINKVSATIREMLSEKGFQFGVVKPEVKPMPGGPKLVHLTFNISEGPKVKIRDIDFVGNTAISDGTLKRRMKETKQQWFLSFITSRGTYQETKFEEDADKVTAFYRDKGYIAARIGQPDLKYLEDSDDRTIRYVQLRVPVSEGARYRVGDFTFDGNTVVKAEALRPFFKLKEGDFYAEKHIRKGLEKAREVYGTGGYFEFTGYPELIPRDEAARDNPEANAGPLADVKPLTAPDGSPIVDVKMKMQQGDQYFVNRITFVGNTTTRDNVIRRELRLVENGIFNTEALKFSVRRLDQLGYFKKLEQDAIQIDKTPDVKNKVDVTLKLEEQNRNQLTFGAGVSQFEGFFGQLSFQTSNFLGRGETFSVAAQAGSRAQNYQVAFSEPFLFDRPITAGVDVFKREIRYPGQFTQASLGGNLVTGFPLANFTRMFLSYSYEQVRVKELNEAFFDPTCYLTAQGCGNLSLEDPTALGPERLELLSRNPFLYDSLLIGQGGRRTISKVTPSLIHNTVDQPIFPSTGRRMSASIDLAGIGGNTNFIKPRLEMIQYIQHTRRTSLGFRAQLEYIKPYGSTTSLPIFEKLFLGGEYSIRGFDIRTVGPRDSNTGLVVGGNKSFLVNAEYLITIAGPVRLVLFYDAGQVRDLGNKFVWKEPLFSQFQIAPFVPGLGDSSTLVSTDPLFEAREVARVSAFKTSTGAEVRFFMPVLNVPFRLIFALNPQRGGVFDNNLQPTKRFTFRFAVGSTF